MTQGIPARVVALDATLEGKPYGTVIYQRAILPGTGRERTLTMDVDENGVKYSFEDKRTCRADGTPIRAVSTYKDDTVTVTMSATFSGKEVTVVTNYGTENETHKYVLEVEKASTVDPSQAWFYGTAPTVGASSTFWEFSFEGRKWIERTIKYEGIAKIKFGDKDINAHRLVLGKETTWYVDEFGMPYKTSQETPSGTLTMVRRGNS